MALQDDIWRCSTLVVFACFRTGSSWLLMPPKQFGYFAGKPWTNPLQEGPTWGRSVHPRALGARAQPMCWPHSEQNREVPRMAVRRPVGVTGVTGGNLHGEVIIHNSIWVRLHPSNPLMPAITLAWYKVNMIWLGHPEKNQDISRYFKIFQVFWQLQLGPQSLVVSSPLKCLRCFHLISARELVADWSL